MILVIILYISTIKFFVDLINNYNKITMILFLSRINPKGTVSFNLKHANDNFTNITYSSKSNISSQTDKN